jgi:dTDP-4-amino-4,6-dideoxygalactose transaminase
MEAIMRIARRHKVIVIEDAAHAHGASYKNRPPVPSGISPRFVSIEQESHGGRRRDHYNQR